MARITILWDQNTVRVWRAKGSSAQLLKEFNTDNVHAMLTSLEAEASAFKMTHVRIYIDLPVLDHHVERVPKLPSKLCRQLLRQRQIKMYGDESRVWVAKDMELASESAQQFFLVSSLPNDISSACTLWARKNGIVFEGIFSLPLALSHLDRQGEPNSESIIEFQPMGSAGYLIARDGVGKTLFFSRLDSALPEPDQLESGAQRLILFVEQEFALTPRLRASHSESIEDAERVVALGRKKLKAGLNLVLPVEKRRQSLQRLRHRSFAVLTILLIAAINFSLPLIERKKALEVNLVTLDTELLIEQRELEQLEYELEAKAAFLDVIQFSEGRETIADDAPVPAPLLVMLHALSNSLPKLVELDSYEGYIDIDQAQAKFIMVGRPLSPDLDLKAEVDALYTGLRKRGWLIEEPKLAFEEKNRSSRFAAQRGDLRKFTLTITLPASGGKL